MVACPECENDLDIDEEEVDEGEVVSCPECGTDFEIITVNPIELKPVEEEWRARHAELIAVAKQSQLLSSREFSFVLFPSEILPARLLDLCKVMS